jgi:hypothetical protein
LVKAPDKDPKNDEKSSQALTRERSYSDKPSMFCGYRFHLLKEEKKIPSRPSFIGSNSELKQSKLFVSYSVLTKVNHQKVSLAHESLYFFVFIICYYGL